LILNWSPHPLTPLNKLTFKQVNGKDITKEISYILSNYQNTFEIPYKDFRDFVPKINVTVELQ
jgi:hypothetical protein